MVTVLYRPNSEHERDTLEFVRRLKGEQQVDCKLVDVDSREAASLIELYDVTRYPGIVVTKGDGTPLQTWQGDLPLVSEVAYFARS
ncbi:hypothetical protein HY346_02800 [Candidatus Microgenomates bacterium]|nr:hypothetical protein [Candidatus Microgenomates bacterium]